MVAHEPVKWRRFFEDASEIARRFLVVAELPPMFKVMHDRLIIAGMPGKRRQ